MIDVLPDPALALLVSHGYPILKVGPGLTFAYREALYGLDIIATELVAGYGDRPLYKAMEAIMRAQPGYWNGHYHGDGHALHIQRHYSYSDRIRYYWGDPEAAGAVEAMLAALRGVEIPETLLRQFIPRYMDMAQPSSDPEAILLMAVDLVLAAYDRACGSQPI